MVIELVSSSVVGLCAVIIVVLGVVAWRRRDIQPSTPGRSGPTPQLDLGSLDQFEASLRDLRDALDNLDEAIRGTPPTDAAPLIYIRRPTRRSVIRRSNPRLRRQADIFEQLPMRPDFADVYGTYPAAGVSFAPILEALMKGRTVPQLYPRGVVEFAEPQMYSHTTTVYGYPKSMVVSRKGAQRLWSRTAQDIYGAIQASNYGNNISIIGMGFDI
jgi:hypothetical protein